MIAQPNVSPLPNLERFGSLNSHLAIMKFQLPIFVIVGLVMVSLQAEVLTSEKGSGGHDLVQLDNTIEKAPLESDHQSHSKRDLEKRKRKRKSKKAKKAKAKA
ncbi:hypothetical protein MJO28_004906 [Puccinia striiformis f. sp. tritici]|uniref:Uncharacterized protein n=4 Tax=Puccinia striiformis TaxID=27350 RepID=A0A2S4VXK7_9BASI|nr:hypothetical protein MJO28_004906 [Puccinia striiformis f. sp. tritici]KAI7959919.1 hypothetical protein MJO29_004987 [Puccinia striiformis f. sp. tritici]POW14274.1 hypothetical protein PSTT_03042 [Puccinia striiformis]